MPTTFERLRLILVRDYKADADALTPEAPLSSLNIDSLGVAELLFTVEDEFKVKVTKEPLAITTVGDVVVFIDGLVASQHATDGSAAAPALPTTDA